MLNKANITSPLLILVLLLVSSCKDDPKFQFPDKVFTIDKIYDVPLEFLTNAQRELICSDTLVPKWFRPVYNRCPGVKVKFETLFTAFKRLNKTKQSALISICISSKNIQNIVINIQLWKHTTKKN